MTTTWARRFSASLFAALASSAVAYAVNLLAYVLVNQFQLSVLPSAVSEFWSAALFAFIVIAVAGLLGALRSWWGSLIVGILAAAISFVLSLIAQIGGDAFSVLGTLTGYYMFFLLGVVVATVTLGRPLFRAVLNRRRRLTERLALVRVPSAELGKGIVTGIERSEVDTALADQQWDAYVAALGDAGWRTVEIAPADRMPDGVFVEDAAIVFGDVALITRPGAEERRRETVTVADGLRAQGLVLYEVEEPGTIDGGDVLQIGSTVYVGRSGRTNAEGIRQLREVVATLPEERTVVAVPVSGVLHLKSAATALPDGTVLVHPELLPDTSVFPRALAVPEKSGVNVVVLDEATVLVPASAPQTAALIEDLGYRTVVVDLSEFEKVEGAATCLSIRLA